MNRNIVNVSKIHSIDVMPMFSIVEFGNDDTLSVRRSTTPVSHLSSEARNPEMDRIGKVNGIRHPMMIMIDESGTIIMFVSMK
jgi:hypothetical protein